MQGLIMGQKGHFFEKFHHSLLNRFSNVLHQNKALHNFYKGGQAPDCEMHKMSRLGPGMVKKVLNTLLTIEMGIQ